MKLLNLFTRVFSIIVVITIGSLALAAYSAKKAYDTDPDLLSKIEKRFNIHITTSNGFNMNMNDSETTQDSWQMPLTQKTIRIKTISGNIAIKATSSSEIVISASGELDKSKSPKLLEINPAEGELSISEPVNAVNDLQLRIEIPSSFKNEIVILSASGDVTIENLSPNSLEVETVSGEIILDTIKADTLVLNTISGDTHLRNSAVTTLSGKSISGEMNVDSKGMATARLKSISGNIDLKLPQSESYRFELKTISGEITNIHTDKSKAVATIEVSTTSGDIKID